jgi:hypothetical protein
MKLKKYSMHGITVYICDTRFVMSMVNVDPIAWIFFPAISDYLPYMFLFHSVRQL